MSETPERIVERERILDAEPERVWDALTDEYLLSDWFAPGASIDPVEGGDVAFECEDGEREGTVRVVDEERELSFTWARPGEEESLVTFMIEPLETGTRLIVTERVLTAPIALAALGVDTGIVWSMRLRSLELCLGRLVFA